MSNQIKVYKALIITSLIVTFSWHANGCQKSSGGCLLLHLSGLSQVNNPSKKQQKQRLHGLSAANGLNGSKNDYIQNS